MGLTGRAAVGGQHALVQLIARQLEQQQLAQQAKQAEVRAMLEQQSLTQRATEHTDNLDLNNRQLAQQGEQAGANRRQQMNIQGMELMQHEADLMRPVAPKRHMITTTGPGGGPLQKLMDEDDPALAAGVPGYRAPTAPREPKEPTKQWLVRNGEEVYDVYQPGDRRATTSSGTASRQKALDEVTLLEQQLNDILTSGEQGKWSGVGGLMRGTMGRVGKQQFGYGDDSSELLRNKIGNLRTDIAHDKFGSAFTGNEKAMLNTFAPDIDRDPTAIKTNIQMLLQQAQRKRAQLSGAGPAHDPTPPDGVPPPAPVKPMSSHGGAAPADPLGIRKPQ